MRSQSREYFFAFFIFFCVAFAVLIPILALGKSFGSSDVILGIYPFMESIRQSLHEGGSLIWSSNVFSGFPQFVLGNFFNPFFILLKYFSVVPLYNLLTFLNLVVAGYLTWLLFRRIGLTFWPSIVGGIVYVFSVWNWIADLSLAVALPVLPGLFLLALSYRHRADFWKIVCTAVVLAYSVYAANFNLLPMILFSFAAYTVVLAYSERPRKLLHMATFFVSSALPAAVLSLPQLVPTLVFTGLSARGAGLSLTESSVGALQVFDVIKLVLPFSQVPVWFSNSYVNLGFLSIVSALFMLRGFFPIRREGRRVSDAFFACLFVFGVLMAVKYSPIFFLLRHVPILNGMRVPTRWLFPAFFSFAYASASGLQYMIEEQSSSLREKVLKWYRVVFYWTAGLLVVWTAIFSFLQSNIIIFAEQYFKEHVYARTTQLPIEHYNSLIEKTIRSVGGSFSLFTYNVAIPIIFLFLGYLTLKRFEGGRLNGPAVTVWVAILLSGYYIFSSFPFHQYIASQTLAKPSYVVSYLQEHPGKFFSLLPGFTEFEKLSVPHTATPQDVAELYAHLLTPNFSSMWGLEGADYYNNLMSRRMSRLLALLGSDRATTGEKLSEEKIPLEKKLSKFLERGTVLSVLGIKYVISAFPLEQEHLKLVLQTQATRFKIPIYLYVNDAARPEVYFADTVQTLPVGEQSAYEAVLGKPLSGRDSYVECSALCTKTVGTAHGTLQVVARKAGDWEINTQNTDERYLVVSENMLPGWRATIDGQATAIYIANSVFLSVLVPPGQHRVSFQYSLAAIAQSISFLK
ncbi:MAG: hypothetical protein A2722_02930 [Candidatus Doudnabacteria bacterium RIFCSPHIGHO2_01_FULL_50_11]|uniref:YfhO family protein n=1 Tax=Candidatus Doudnabacteria bacterium RIFCSPHIGHO2_01_FULL_50_11 TaxID=1817828 RepID=A0A1F5PHC1_9BACT|nr:MAG: hypothetical protein A2722_02930 [Candidatus Doudnabacteria bacterium RIFCSPHIGHO2_01_FULL_50_11]HLC45160.1 YfhO family protein [Patescibacteria group bacterium]